MLNFQMTLMKRLLKCLTRIGIGFLCLFVFFNNAFCSEDSGQTDRISKTWYRGCVDVTPQMKTGNQSIFLKYDKKTEPYDILLKLCFRFCIKNNNSYVAISIDRGCVCFGDNIGIKTTFDGCQSRCRADSNATESETTDGPSSSIFHWHYISMPCGGLTSGNVSGNLSEDSIGRSEGQELTEGTVLGSLYSTDLPFVLSIRASTFNGPLVTGQVFEVEVEIDHVGNLRMSPGVEGLDGLDVVGLKFCNKTSAGKLHQHALTRPTVRATCTINSPGKHVLDLKVFNLVSEATNSVVVNIVPLTDSDLTIFPSAEDNFRYNATWYWMDETPSRGLKLFVNDSARFEARALFTTNSSFYWTASCIESGRVSIVHSSASPAIGCRDEVRGACTRTTEDVTFARPGICSVQVIANRDPPSQIAGRLNLTVILPLKDIEISFSEKCKGFADVKKEGDDKESKTIDSCQGGEALTLDDKIIDVHVPSDCCGEVRATLGEPTSLQVSVTTAFYSSTLVEVSFGDGELDWYWGTTKLTLESVPFLRSYLSGFAISERPEMSIVRSEGKQECRTTLALTHAFRKEGVFLVEVRSHIVLEGRTFILGPIRAERRIKVLDPMKSISIVGLDSVLRSHERATIHARGPQGSYLGKLLYSWRFLCLPFVYVSLVQPALEVSQSRPNSISFSDGSNLLVGIKDFASLTYGTIGQSSVPYMYALFSGSGFCKIEVKVEGGTSSVSNIVDAKVESQVSWDGVRCHIISLRRDSKNISTESQAVELEFGSKLSCHVQGLEGSSVSVAWNLCRLVDGPDTDSAFSDGATGSEGACESFNSLHFSHTFRRSGVFRFSADLWNCVSSLRWPETGSLTVSVEREDPRENGFDFSGAASSVEISVISIDLKADGDWSGGSGRVSSEVVVTFELTFVGSERAFNVSLDFGELEVEEYMGVVRSKFDISKSKDLGEGGSRRILFFEPLESPRDEKGPNNKKSPQNDGDESVNDTQTYTAVLNRTLEFNWSTRDKVALVSIECGPIVASNFTHFSIPKPIDHFELKTSLHNDSLPGLIDFVVMSSVEFDDMLSFDWMCSNCTIMHQGRTSNGSHWMLWSLCRTKHEGPASVTLTVTNPGARKVRRVDLSVSEPAEANSGEEDVESTKNTLDAVHPDDRHGDCTGRGFSPSDRRSPANADGRTVCERPTGKIFKKDVIIVCTPTVVKVMDQFSCVSNFADRKSYSFKWEVSPATALLSKLSLDGPTIINVVLARGSYHVRMKVNLTSDWVPSNEVLVHVLEPLVNVKLAIVSPRTMPGRPITFEVEHYKSKMTQCEWTFGDGSKPIITQNGLVNHFYESVGRYEVRVNVSNPISHALATVQVFVTDDGCRPPKVFFLQSSASNAASFNRSDSIVVGAEIEFECNSSRLIDYTWTVRSLADNSTVMTLKVHDITLVLPPYSLPYGIYSIVLNVSVANSVVYGFSRTPYSFRVSESPVEAVMFGGFQRSAHRDGFVVMDATSSFDPDFPDSKDLSFQWNCTDFKSRPIRRSCFRPGREPPYNWPAFKFPASDLLNSSDFNNEYMFTVVVSRPDRVPRKATQILNLQSEPSVPVSILCRECRSGLVNSNDYTTLVAEIRDDPAGQPGDRVYGDDDYDYEWGLFVEENKDWEKFESERRACVLEDGKLKVVESYVEERGLKYKSRFSATRPTPPSLVEVHSSTSGTHPKLPTRVASYDPPPFHSDGRHLPPGGVPESNAKKTDAGKGVPAVQPRAKVVQDELFELASKHRLERLLQEEEFVGSTTNRRRLRIVPNTLIQGVRYFVKLHVRNRETDENSFSTMTFKVNDAPSHGVCSKRRIESTNQLSVSCYGWEDSDGPIYYELNSRFQDSRRERILYRGLNHNFKVKLPRDISAPNRSVSIGIRVSDRYGASTQVCHESYETYQWPEGTPPLEMFRTFVSRGFNDAARLELFHLLGGLDVHANASSSVLPVSVNGGSSSNDSHDIGLLFREVIPALQCMPIRGRPELETVLEVLNLALVPGARASLRGINGTLSIVAKLTAVLEDLTSPASRMTGRGFGSNAELVVELLVDVTSKLVDLLGSHVDDGKVERELPFLRFICDAGTADSLGSSTSYWQPRDSPLFFFHAVRGVEPSHELLMKDYLSSAIDIAHRLLSLQTVLRSDDLYLLSPQRVAHQGKAYSFYSLLHRGRRPLAVTLVDGVSFALPVASLPIGGESESIGWRSGTSDPIMLKFEYVGNRMGGSGCCILSSLLFNQDKDKGIQTILPAADEIHGSTEVLSLRVHSCQGRPLPVRGFPDTGKITMEMPIGVDLASRCDKNDTKDASSESFVLKMKLMNVHRIELRAREGVGRLHIDLNFSTSSTFHFFYPAFLLLGVDQPPSADEYDKKIFIKPQELSHSATFDLSRYTKAPSSVYLGLINQVFRAPRKSLPHYMHTRNYSIRVWSLRCMHLDEKTLAWRSDGCVPAENSTWAVARCRCNLASSHSGHVTIHPSPLYAMTSFASSEEPPPNYASVVFLSCLLAIYTVLLVACSAADREDWRRPSVVHLCDNSPTHRQKYSIIVETGFRAGAGTTAKVSIVLHGKYGMSETRELTTSSSAIPASSSSSAGVFFIPDYGGATAMQSSLSTEEERRGTVRGLFQRNSRDVFLVTLPESLGPIFKVQLWHNNGGSSPSWYLSKVTVRDHCTGEVFYFLFERWFAVEKDDGKVEREAFAADRGPGFLRLFRAKGIQYLTDYHIWLSVAFRPRHSRFTHVQRLTCCLVATLGHAALAAMYYSVGLTLLRRKLIDQPSTDPSDFDGDGQEFAGDYDDVLLMNLGLSGHQIAIGVAVSLASFLPNLLVQFLFRRSTVRLSDAGTSKPGRAHGQPTLVGQEGEEDGGQTNHGYRYRQEVDHTFLSWRSLQEWVFAKQYSQDVIGDQVIRPVATQNDAYVNIYDRGGTMEAGNGQSGASRNDPLNPVGPVMTNENGQEELSRRVKMMNEKNQQNREFSARNFRPAFLVIGAGEEKKAVDGKGSDESCVQKIVYEQRSNRSSVKSEVSEPSRPPMKEPRLFLSRHFVGLAWFIVVALSVIFVAVTIYLTFRISEVKSFLWIQSVFFSFLQCAFVNQPILVLVMSLWTAFRHCNSMLAFDHYNDGYEDPDGRPSDPSSGSRKSDIATEHLSVDGLQGKSDTDVSVEQGLLARQRSRYLRLVRPPQEQKLIEARHQTMKENNALHFIREMVTLSLQLVLILFICYGTSSNTDTYRINSKMEEKFVRLGARESFMNITALKHWDLWYSTVFRPSLSSLVKNNNFLLVGGLKLRQVRVLDVPCSVMKYQLVPVVRCLPLYASANLLRDKFSPGPVSVLPDELEPDLDVTSPYPLNQDEERGYEEDHPLTDFTGDHPEPRGAFLTSSHPPPDMPEDSGAGRGEETECMSEVLSRYTQFRPVPLGDDDDVDDEEGVNNSRVLDNEAVWSYREVSHSTLADYWGWFGNYGSGGFIVDLTDIQGSNASSPMKFLRNHGWVDLHTSALLLTVTLYHPASNLFTSVALGVELPPIGRVFPSYKVSTVSIYKYIDIVDKIVFACELLFFIITFLRIHHKVYRLSQSGLREALNFWNVLEVILCLLSLSFIGCYIYRYSIISEALESLREAFYQKTEADAFSVADWDQLLRVHLGFILIVLTLFLLKSLQRQEPFDALFNVIGRSAVDVAVLAFITLVWFGAFISCGMMTFGSSRAHFGMVSRAIGQALSVLLLRPLTVGIGSQDGSSASFFWDCVWPFYHAFFMLLGFVLILCYIRTSLLFNFRVFRSEPLMTFSAKESSAFYWSRLKRLLKLENRSNDDSELPDESGANHLFDQLLPEFTMTEMENQVDEVLFKMNALTGGSNLPEKPATYYSDSEANPGPVEDATSGRNFEQPRSRSKPPQTQPVDTCGTDPSVDYHRQILMKLELEVLKQTRQQREQQQQQQDRQLQPALKARLQPSASQGLPLPVTGPSSSLPLSSSSPQLLANRKIEDKNGVKGIRSTNNIGGRPPLPRVSASPLSAALPPLDAAPSSQIQVASPANQVSGISLSLAGRIKAGMTSDQLNSSSVPPTLSEGGLRRSRSFRCRRLETMAEETEEGDTALRNSVRRGKSADSNLVAVYMAEKRGQQMGKPNFCSTNTVGVARIDTIIKNDSKQVKFGDLELTQKTQAKQDCDIIKPSNVVIEITPDSDSGMASVPERIVDLGRRSDQRHPEEMRLKLRCPRDCIRDPLVASESIPRKNSTIEMRQEKPPDEETREVEGCLFGGSRPSSDGSATEIKGRCSSPLRTTRPGFRKESKYKRTKSRRVIDDLV